MPSDLDTFDNFIKNIRCSQGKEITMINAQIQIKMLDKKQGTSEQGQPIFPLVSSSFLLEAHLAQESIGFLNSFIPCLAYRRVYHGMEDGHRS